MPPLHPLYKLQNYNGFGCVIPEGRGRRVGLPSQGSYIYISISIYIYSSIYILYTRIDLLKSNSSEVWERLKMDEQRLCKLESSMDKLYSKLDEKVEMIQEWVGDMTARATPDIPAEIIN